MAAQVVLVYDCVVGAQPSDAASALFARIRDLPLDPESATATLLGLSLASDVTTDEAGGVIRRTLTYNVTATGNANFPSDAAIQDATRKLFGKILELRVPARVTSAEPVVS